MILLIIQYCGGCYFLIQCEEYLSFSEREEESLLSWRNFLARHVVAWLLTAKCFCGKGLPLNQAKMQSSGIATFTTDLSELVTVSGSPLGYTTLKSVWLLMVHTASEGWPSLVKELCFITYWHAWGGRGCSITVPTLTATPTYHCIPCRRWVFKAAVYSRAQRNKENVLVVTGSHVLTCTTKTSKVSTAKCQAKCQVIMLG